LLIVIVLYAIPAMMVMKPVADPDIWWHLRTGQWIVEHKAVTSTDPFTSFGPSTPWMAYSWLFEVIVYELYRWLGLYGVILMRAALAFAVAAAVHRFIVRREPRFLIATGIAGAAFLCFASLMTERPWLFTLLFFIMTFDAVLDLRDGRATWKTWLLPLAYVLWANLHIQFVYGLFLLGLACAAPVIDRMMGRDESGDDARTAGSRGWWKLVALTAACTAATLINPYHVRLYGVIAEYATQPLAFELVTEHRAMEFRGPVDWAVLAIAGWAAFALGRRTRLGAFEVLVLVSAAYFSFHTRRDLWFVVLAAIAILTAGGLLPGRLTDRFALYRARVAIVAGTVVFLLGIIALGRGLSPAGLQQAVDEIYPAKAVQFVEEQNLPGPLFNHFDWGGYLIWRLPRLPVAIDGRTNLQGDKRLDRFHKTWAGESGWDADPDLVAAKLVIAQAKCPLASLLKLDGRFKPVYEDKVATVFVRSP
jgi:hypothetical protein